MSHESRRLDSVCVYCGSSDAVDPQLLEDAAEVGREFARAGLRLVYGGGGVGLMGASAGAAHDAGGRVLGIIPSFLIGRERPLTKVETQVVETMAERKKGLFDESDAFVVLPGGVGTLEEIVELLSWRRMNLHDKPVVFYSPNGFWDPLFTLFQHTIDTGFTPAAFNDAWRVVERPQDIVPALRAMAAADPVVDVSDAISLT
ncbi:MAG: TIGR00730 family Rossman fold protein [Caulobacter sp.]